MHPFISIIIPIYNISDGYLGDCISSVLDQTMRDIEIIIVDDGSHSQCALMCDAIAEADDRVMVIHQSNQGVSAARNAGIRAARADWIMFVDADDWLENHTCATVYKHLKEYNGDILMFRAFRESDRSVVMDNGFDCGRRYDLSVPCEREFLYRMMVSIPSGRSPAYYSWDKVWRRSFLLENDLCYPIGLAKSEDKVFVMSCLEKTAVWYQIDDTLYHYRINDASVCHRYSADIDHQRIALANTLSPIVERMNTELTDALDRPDYCRLNQDYTRFLFGVISDVLYLKFYHTDNPDRKQRRIQALEFIKREPFCSVIEEVSYSSLSYASKFKKWCLLHGFVSTFCFVRRFFAKIFSP